jgi:hypothetical protein
MTLDMTQHHTLHSLQHAQPDATTGPAGRLPGDAKLRVSLVRYTHQLADPGNKQRWLGANSEVK